MQKIARDTLKGKAINQLQKLKTVVVAGVAAANTDINVTGVKKGDTVQSAILYTAGVPSDVTTGFTINADGKFRSTGATGAGNQLVISYWPAAV